MYEFNFQFRIDNSKRGNDAMKAAQFDKHRIGYIDLAKGIAILSMVLCHVCNLPYVYAWIYSLHMPIFFIISGILLTNKKVFNKESFDSNFIKKLKTIIWPYITFSVIYCCLDIIKDNMDESFLWIIKHTVYYFVFGYHALWFLPAMFIANILFNIFHSLSKNWARFLIDTLLLIGTSIIAQYVVDKDRTLMVYIIIFFNRALIGYLFIEFGYYLINIIDVIKNEYLKLITAVLCLGIDTYTALLNVPDLHFSLIGNPLLYYFNAIIGTLGILLLCNWIDRIKDLQLLKYCGMNSIIVLLTHILFVEFLKEPIMYVVIGNSESTKWFNLCFFMGICIVEITIIGISNKYFSWLYDFSNLGSDDKKSIQ